jgi:glycerate kinase
VLASLGATSDGILDSGAIALDTITWVDLSPAKERLAGVELVAASDVDNPLTGMFGATKTFGPQKGIEEDRVVEVDGWLEKFATATDRRTSLEKGAGAAGGIGFALLALGATREPGIALVARHVRLAERARAADLVITGEGAFDFSSRSGKVPYGVAESRGRCPATVRRAGRTGVGGVAGDAGARHRVGLLARRPRGGGARVRGPVRVAGGAGRTHRPHVVSLTSTAAR